MVALVAVVMMTWAMLGCAKPTQPTVLLSEPTVEPNQLAGQIVEVSPPETLEVLKQIIDAYTPQVRILSPRPGEILETTTASVRVQVRGLPLFKDETWQLGPHLHVFLDDEPYQAVYDPSEPLVFENLAPGTHTLRVFASRPWHESFKNQGAFDQRTFYVFAQTPQNEVNASAPLLTYSRPQGTYGAEPVMLDFYLTNAPLHLSAQEDAKDDLHDWRIRCTVNGQSFVFDQWQPIYLKGFQPGQNWVQLELIDETGRSIDNRFNNTVRIIDYQPGGTDTLSQLVRGELDLRQVAGIIDPTYVLPQPEPATESPVEPEPEQPFLPQNEPTPSNLAPASPAQPKASTESEPESSLPQAEPTLSNQEPPLSDTEPGDLSGKLPADDGKELPAQEPESGTANQPKVELPTRSMPEADLSNEPEDSFEFAPASEPEVQPPATQPSSTDLPRVTAPANEAMQPPDLGASSTIPEKEPATKGLMNRFRAWQKKARSPAPAPSGDSRPLQPLPTYEAPAENAPATEQTEPAVIPEEPATIPEPSADIDLPRVMPELIEPDLPQPYLTDPRTESLPLPSHGNSVDGKSKADQDNDKPTAPAPEIPSQGKLDLPFNRMNRPYI
jgi:hypothetical protein